MSALTGLPSKPFTGEPLAISGRAETVTSAAPLLVTWATVLVSDTMIVYEPPSAYVCPPEMMYVLDPPACTEPVEGAVPSPQSMVAVKSDAGSPEGSANVANCAVNALVSTTFDGGVTLTLE